MQSKKFIEENNEKRKLLNKENLTYYEDMLVYIRLSYNKSEQETEEVLTELLDHLLDAQEAGKTAEDVFGDNPKQYADQIVDELPKILTKERIYFISIVIVSFFSISIFITSIVDLVLFYFFDRGESYKSIFLGSILIEGILSIGFAFLFIWMVFHYLRYSTFKNIGKVKEFFFLWLLGVVSLSVFIGVILLVPDFGTIIDLSNWLLFFTSMGLFFIEWLLLKK